MTTIERQSLAEFLEVYREQPCLWDQTNAEYSDRFARTRAYTTLLEKYKEIYHHATLEHVKKRIENMRCAYRREHRKVLQSQMRGTGLEYRPTLWYYDNLSFLNNITEFKVDTTQDTSAYDQDMIDEDEQEVLFEEIETKPKKAKKSKISAIYLNDTHDEKYEPEQFPSSSLNLANDEAESFGRTIGFQLAELNPKQRVIAEKLISDIIFHGRLNRLKVRATLTIDDDDDD